jgi:hypothetical protein
MKDILFSKIDLPASRLKPYEGFIFLCGGPTDVRSVQPISIRDAIYRELVKHDNIERRIRVAEHYKDWSHESIYRDLVSFERHLAELSSVIVLVLESPGSIAEFGLFSVIAEFRSKLLVFIETDHYASPSFIKLGLVDFLEKVHDNTVECHRWMIDIGSGSKGTKIFDSNTAEELQPELAEAILERVRKPTAERAFQPSSWLDNALLLCDFLNLYSALTLREIKSLFDGFEYMKQESELKQLLFILEKVELLAMEPNGNQRFYVSIEPKQFFRFHLRDNSFDLSRFRTDVLAHYERSDKKRFRAIQEVRRRYAER